MNKQQITQKIASMEKELAELKKELEKKDEGIWKPEQMEDYYFVGDCGEVEQDINECHNVDSKRFDFGGYYKTKEEATKMSNYLKYTNLLRKYVEEHSEPLKWKRSEQKYYLWLDVDPYTVKIGNANWAKQQGTIYASSEEVLRDAISFLGEENIKRYIFGIEE